MTVYTIREKIQSIIVESDQYGVVAYFDLGFDDPVKGYGRTKQEAVGDLFLKCLASE